MFSWMVLPVVLDAIWLLTVVIALLTLFLVRHFLTVWSLPPGPFPFPILGNLMEFTCAKVSPPAMLEIWRQKYGDIFTVWLGPRPTVVVCKWALNHEALVTQKNNFSGRVHRRSTEIFMGGSNGIMFTDYGPCWETLRKIMVTAVRTYASSEKLAYLVTDVVDEVTDLMAGEGKPVDVNNYMYLIVYNILASSSFGKRFAIDDPDFVQLRHDNKIANEAIGDGLPGDILPILQFFFRKQEEIILGVTKRFNTFVTNWFNEHKKDFTAGIVRDFTDAILAAREEAKMEEKDTKEHMTDKNLVAVISEVFSAGSDTTRVTLNWLLLTICDNPEIQEKMQSEISKNIGTRPPVQSDKDILPYTHAVITEILRLRIFTDFTIERKCVCNTKIDWSCVVIMKGKNKVCSSDLKSPGGFKIPKFTSVFFNILSCHQDQTLWPEPHLFLPERFLESDGSFLKSRPTGFMSFSLGRRSCPGEKLARADLFLIVTRLLQRCHFRLENGPGTGDFQAKVLAFANHPQPFNVSVIKRE